MRFIPLILVIISFLSFLSAGNAQIVLTKVSDMEFGVLSYDTSHAGELLLGTDGNVVLSGATGLVHEGSSSAGSVTIIGNPLDVIEIKCVLAGRMVDASGSRIRLRDLEVSLNSGVAAGNANACNNTGRRRAPAIVHDLAVDPNPTILMGARATIRNNSLNSGTYSSAFGGGNNIRLRVIFQ